MIRDWMNYKSAMQNIAYAMRNSTKLIGRKNNPNPEEGSLVLSR